MKTITDWSYDLNVFSSNENGVLDTVQPSIYFMREPEEPSIFEKVSDRVYLQSFKVPTSERKSLRVAFDEDEWGDDFFLSLDCFYDEMERWGVPTAFYRILSNLPVIGHDLVLSDLEYDKHGEVVWNKNV
jgi:hypothetical protein